MCGQKGGAGHREGEHKMRGYLGQHLLAPESLNLPMKPQVLFKNADVQDGKAARCPPGTHSLGGQGEDKGANTSKAGLDLSPTE